MKTKEDTAEKTPNPPPVEPASNIPSGPTSNPPGGGKWRWDEIAKEWISLDEPPPQPTEKQE